MDAITWGMIILASILTYIFRVALYHLLRRIVRAIHPMTLDRFDAWLWDKFDKE